MLRSVKIVIYALLLNCLIPVTIYAAPTAQSLQQKYAGIEGIKASFNQTLTHKESGARDVRSGVFYFKKPLLVRWETTKPVPELLLVGSDAVWNVFPDEEAAYKYSLALAQDSRSIVRVITGQTRMDQDFYIENEGKEGGLHTIRLYPKEPSQSLVEAILWVDDSDLIKKVRVYDFYGNENEIAFTHLTIGNPGKNALFQYVPPKHFVLKDYTKDTGAVMHKPLMQ